MVSSESGTELAINSLKLRRDKHSSHGEAVSYTFSHGDYVGTYPKMLMCKELTATAVSTLYLITDENSSSLITSLTQTLHKFSSSKLDASDALDALHYTSCYIAFLQFGTPRLQIVQRKEGSMSVGVYRSYYLRVIRYLNCQ